MHNRINRRHFLKNSLAATSLAAAMSFEEQNLLAQQNPPAQPAPPPPNPMDFPTGKLGKLNISRMICGGNLISGFAHSRDLIYVSPLLRHYFTDEKIFETLALCESQGINTAILRLDTDTLRLLKTYWKDRGGKMQWIAQVAITERDMYSELKVAIDSGAVAVYTHGGVADTLVKSKRVDLLGKAVDFIKKNGAVAGIAGHQLAVPMACEEANINPDFYMKTFNSKQYWSAKPEEEKDNIWERTPEETAAFMQKVNKPWIAYKVLGAGAIHPREGFGYAFEHGADFICVGMFDFQVVEDVGLARKAFEKAQKRARPWCA